MVSISVIQAITWIVAHLPTTDGWKAELACRTLYPQSGHMSTIDQAYRSGKVRQPETDVLTTESHRQATETATLNP